MKEGQKIVQKSACVQKTFPVQVRQGILWVFPGENPIPSQGVSLPLLPELDDEDAGWTVSTSIRDVNYDITTLFENALDASHVPYTHHNTFGNRDKAAPMDITRLSFGKLGFCGVELEDSVR